MVRQLGGQINQLAQSQAAQAQTLAQLAQGSQATAQAVSRAAQPAPDPDGYARLNEQYLRTFANDPVCLRQAEKQALAQEIAMQLRQEMHQNIGMAERQRRAEEMERQIYQQHPVLMSEGPYLEFYLNHLNRSPQSAGWAIDQKVDQAIRWAYENKAEREQAIIQAHERSQRQIARASAPGGGFSRDPSGADQGSVESPEEANVKRFEALQTRRQAAMGGGRYIK